MAKSNETKTAADPQDATVSAGNTNIPPAPETPPVGAQNGSQGASKPADSVYSAADLAGDARKRFGVPPEVVTAAMKMAGKRWATLIEAERTVKEFLEREVK
jgi:hypothetical protein